MCTWLVLQYKREVSATVHNTSQDVRMPRVQIERRTLVLQYMRCEYNKMHQMCIETRVVGRVVKCAPLSLYPHPRESKCLSLYV